VDFGLDGRSKREAIEVALVSWPVAIGLALALGALGVAAGATAGTAKLILAAILVGVAGLSAFVTWLRSSKKGGYRRAGSRFTRLVAGAGLPVVRALADLCAAPPGCGPDDARLITLRSAVVETAKTQCGGTEARSKVRSVIYEFRGTCDLHRATFSGRQREPRLEFRVSDVPGGRAVVEFAAQAGGRVDRVADVRDPAERVRGIVDSDADYRSFMSTPVAVAGRSWGMLTVDCSDTKAFQEEGEGILGLLANVLAAGLAHAGVSPYSAGRVTVAE
jgi:putative methionine-R-sulfoxide reductase with GAF domain